MGAADAGAHPDADEPHAARARPRPGPELLTLDNSTRMVGRRSPGASLPTAPKDLLQGTLDLLILRILAAGPMHGWAVSQRINEVSEQILRVNQGSLYPALHRLEGKGLLDAEWGMSDTERRVRFYRLTPTGRRQLAAETRGWLAYARAVHLILQTS
jgi:transcriptional regulator